MTIASGEARQAVLPARISNREAQERKQRLAALLSSARADYAAEIRNGQGGLPALSKYTRRIDDLIRDIVQLAQGPATAPFAVSALGGYGRRALCLHSDIDLLVVFDGAIGAPEERLVKALLHPLWDLGFTVGHQVRELSDFEHLDEGNPEFLLALLDARLLAGEPRVFKAVRKQLPRPGRERARVVLDLLRALLERRHAEFNNTFYQLEPDIKEAPGGLRDVAAIHWISVLLGEGRRIGNGRFDERRLHEAEDFLLRVRSILHLQGGRNTNVLSHPLQELTADILGFTGTQPQQRVERLMGEYFRHARTISRVLDWSLTAARGTPTPTEPVRLWDNLELSHEGVRFVDRTRAASDPGSWLLAFQTALERGCAVSDRALTAIHRNLERFTADDFVRTPAAREMLKEIFRPRRGLYARLSEMHDCGLLGCVFPEFDRIHCRVIRDFYHKYTVDEHTLLTLRNLELLLDPPGPARARFSGLLHEIHAPQLLSLALLLHDVGKWKDEDHAIESVRMSQPVLHRLGLTGDAGATVRFLIEHHLQMSRVAFRRDTEDPDVVREFANLVGTEERLKMLCLMTFVDIDAVGPGTLTPWKEELLWRLYVDTYNHLTLAYADQLIEKNQPELIVLQAGRPADISEAELLKFVGGLPQRYLTMFEYRHVRLARDIQPDHVHAVLEHKNDVWELTVVALDKPFLFSNISGVLSYFGMDILRGQAMTTPEGLVLDVFQFTDQEGFLQHNKEATSEVCRVLQDVVAGTVDVTSLLSGKARSLLYRRPRRVSPVVYFDSEHSRKYTVLEIVADDVPGLLYRISQVVSRHGCDVDLVLISTEGHRAVDVFHVTTGKRKLSESEQLALKQSLVAMLEEGYEAH